VRDFISTFDHLDFKIEGMLYAFLRECFISGLNDEIQAQVLMDFPHTWLEATKCTKEAQHVVYSQNTKTSFISHPIPPNPTPHATPLMIQKLAREKMVERQLKGLCYNWDDNYFRRHKCKEHKIFMVIYEDVSSEDVDVSPVKKYPKQMILFHSLILQKLNHWFH